MLLIQFIHRLAHAKGRGDRPIGCWERRHHRIADRPHYCAGLGSNNASKGMKVRAYEVVRSQVANAFVERYGVLEIGEQECETGDIQALVDIERFGAVDLAESLVTEEALCR